VVAHLVEKESRGDGLEAAVRRALQRIRGLYALVLISTDDPETIVAVRNGPPLVVGLGEGEFFVASDVPAILAHTRKVVFLEDQEVVIVTRAGARFTNFAGKPVEKTPQHITWDPVMAEKAGYRHFMLKEINEQPWAVRETVLGRTSLESGRVFLEEMKIDAASLASINRVLILACGTSWHSALVGKFLIEELAHVPVEVDYGSEYRYRHPLVDSHTLAIAITQSGETADTLGALREAKRRGARSLAICNVVGSMATREADGTVYTHAGPEIGVASTKAFTTQLIALQLFAIHLGQVRGTLKPDVAKTLIAELDRLPRHIEDTLKVDSAIEALASETHQHSDFLYLGRGINYPIALEGALKLKEVSYIHAEGYPAGEMKHGPIALLEEGTPVVVVATRIHVYDKIVSNIQETRARGAHVIAIATDGNEDIQHHADDVIYVPKSPAFLQAALAILPLQLLAYRIARIRGLNVDQPRNLAKTVTVE
jgi:glucosamine--fructose-6-phosphate aminotransferase (isomerizing)